MHWSRQDWASLAYAGMELTHVQDWAVNVPWPSTPGGPPLVDTLDTQPGTTVDVAPENYTPRVGEAAAVTGETFSPTSNFTLGKVVVLGNGSALPGMSVHLLISLPAPAGRAICPAVTPPAPRVLLRRWDDRARGRRG